MAHLAAGDRAKLLNANVTKLYNLPIGTPIAESPTNGEAVATHV
jgi:hypothetical protein